MRAPAPLRLIVGVFPRLARLLMTSMFVTPPLGPLTVREPVDVMARPPVPTRTAPMLVKLLFGAFRFSVNPLAGIEIRPRIVIGDKPELVITGLTPLNRRLPSDPVPSVMLPLEFPARFSA